LSEIDAQGQAQSVDVTGLTAHTLTGHFFAKLIAYKL
jgi:hypothetical protein